jgi:hypothetical protein
MNSKFTFPLFFAAVSAWAQTNAPNGVSNSLPQVSQTQTNQRQSTIERAEQIRAACIQGERSICGKVLKIFPDGLVVESGYTNLLRSPLNRSWLAPGTVTAGPPTHSIESNERGAVCIGLVFLSDIPKGRLAKVKQYDYVIVHAFPAGHRTYTSIGDIHRTVRRFSFKLEAAVEYNLRMEEENEQAPAGEVK